jgi:hypothetical protein
MSSKLLTLFILAVVAAGVTSPTRAAAPQGPGRSGDVHGLPEQAQSDHSGRCRRLPSHGDCRTSGASPCISETLAAP